MKLFFTLVAVFFYSSVGQAAQLTDDQVKGLVNLVCSELKETSQEKAVFDKIIAGEHPYKNKDNPAFYVFVYDTKVNIVAHPKKSLVGRNYKGKPDVKGKKFRDGIVNGALKNQKGWEDYVYQKPGAKGLYDKTAYYQLCKTKAGTPYVVVCGKYKDKK